MPKAWQWDMRRSDEEIRKILKDPKHPSFLHYAALLLARINIPKEVFNRYLGKEDFCIEWQKIKRRMRKDRLSQDRLMATAGRSSEVTLRKPAKTAVKDSLRARIGKRIREIRRSKKMTQAELARESGLSQQFLSKIEQGTENISLDTVERIQKSLKESLFGKDLG